MLASPTLQKRWHWAEPMPLGLWRHCVTWKELCLDLCSATKRAPALGWSSNEQGLEKRRRKCGSLKTSMTRHAIRQVLNYSKNTPAVPGSTTCLCGFKLCVVEISTVLSSPVKIQPSITLQSNLIEPVSQTFLPTHPVVAVWAPIMGMAQHILMKCTLKVSMSSCLPC